MRATTTRITVLPTPAGSGLHIPLLQSEHAGNGAPSDIGTSHSHRHPGHTTHRQLQDVISRARVLAERTLAPALEPTPQPTPWPSSPEVGFLNHGAARIHSTPEEMSGGSAMGQVSGHPKASPSPRFSPSSSPSPRRPKASTRDTHYGDNHDDCNDDEPGDTTIRPFDEEDIQDLLDKKSRSQSHPRPHGRDSKPDPRPYAIPPPGHRREHWVPFPLLWDEPQALHERRGLDMQTLDMTKVDAKDHHADAPPPPNTPDHAQPHHDHSLSIERPQRSLTSRASWGNWFAWSPWWVCEFHWLLTDQIMETHTSRPLQRQPATIRSHSCHIFSSWPSAHRQLLTHFPPDRPCPATERLMVSEI